MMDSPTSIESPISAALVGLYESFQLPRPEAIDGCPCCITPEELRALVTVPRETLTGAQLAKYAFSVMWTVGTPTDLRYFLPRLIELLTLGQLPVNQETLFKKCHLGEWRSWPLREQSALEAFARAIIHDMAERVYAWEDVDSWICALAQFLDDITMVMEPLLSDRPAAQENLLRLYEWNLRALSKKKLANNFFDKETPNYQRLVAWFHSTSVLTAIDKAYTTDRSQYGDP